MLLLLFRSRVLNVSAPRDLSLWNSFGSVLLFLVALQVLSGFLLSFVYTSSFGFVSVSDAVVHLPPGICVRLVHLVGASILFAGLFLHMFRAVSMALSLHRRVWLSGWFLLVLIIMSAFLGYVLVWGQMSFWAAKVITGFYLFYACFWPCTPCVVLGRLWRFRLYSELLLFSTLLFTPFSVVVVIVGGFGVFGGAKFHKSCNYFMYFHPVGVRYAAWWPERVSIGVLGCVMLLG